MNDTLWSFVLLIRRACLHQLQQWALRTAQLLPEPKTATSVSWCHSGMSGHCCEAGTHGFISLSSHIRQENKEPAWVQKVAELFVKSVLMEGVISKWHLQNLQSFGKTVFCDWVARDALRVPLSTGYMMLTLSFGHVESVGSDTSPSVEPAACCLPQYAGKHGGFSCTWQHLLHLSEEADHIPPFTVNAPVPVCALVHVGRPVRNSLESTSIRGPFVLLERRFFEQALLSLSSLTFDWLPTICCKNTRPNLSKCAFWEKKNVAVFFYWCCCCPLVREELEMTDV